MYMDEHAVRARAGRKFSQTNPRLDNPSTNSPVLTSHLLHSVECCYLGSYYQRFLLERTGLCAVALSNCGLRVHLIHDLWIDTHFSLWYPWRAIFHCLPPRAAVETSQAKAFRLVHGLYLLFHVFHVCNLSRGSRQCLQATR